MVGGDYTAHSTPGETRHSPQSDRARARAHTHTHTTRVTLISACTYIQTHSHTPSACSRARVLNYAHVVRQWPDVYYIYACSFVSRDPDVPLFSLLFSLLFVSPALFSSQYFSLSLSSFVPLSRSFCQQCFLLRSSSTNVHLSRTSDEELIAPESLALLLADERTDGRTDATWGEPLCSFERGFPYRRAENACVVCVYVRSCGCTRRKTCTRASLLRTLRPKSQVAARRRVFGSTESARFVRGSRISGRRGQSDRKIIVQTNSFPLFLSFFLFLFLSLSIFPAGIVGHRIKIAITEA